MANILTKFRSPAVLQCICWTPERLATKPAVSVNKCSQWAGGRGEEVAARGFGGGIKDALGSYLDFLGGHDEGAAAPTTARLLQ